MLNTRLPAILVPKNEEGLKKICEGYRGDDESYFTFSFSRVDLENIFITDFFTLINAEFSLEIDEYEEVIILDSNLIKSIWNYLLLVSKDDDDSVFLFYLEKIILCFKKALEFNSGIAFFF